MGTTSPSQRRRLASLSNTPVAVLGKTPSRPSRAQLKDITNSNALVNEPFSVTKSRMTPLAPSKLSQQISHR